MSLRFSSITLLSVVPRTEYQAFCSLPYELTDVVREFKHHELNG